MDQQVTLYKAGDLVEYDRAHLGKKYRIEPKKLKDCVEQHDPTNEFQFDTYDHSTIETMWDFYEGHIPMNEYTNYVAPGFIEKLKKFEKKILVVAKHKKVYHSSMKKYSFDVYQVFYNGANKKILFWINPKWVKPYNFQSYYDEFLNGDQNLNQLLLKKLYKK